MLRVRILVLVLVVGALWPASGWAAQTAKLKVSFTPNNLGGSTTIHFAVDIGTTTGRTPSPVTDINIGMPNGLGLANTDLGEETCDAAVLLEFGASGCPANSRLGIGTALVELPIGPEPVQNRANVTIFMGTPINHHTTMLFYAEGLTPVAAQLVFISQLLPGNGIFGVSLNTSVPLTPTVPEAADASVVRLETTLGPSHLTYYDHVHGTLRAYQPTGITIPERCPRGGFPFDATFTFQDATTASAKSNVACPARRSTDRRVGRRRR